MPEAVGSKRLFLAMVFDVVPWSFWLPDKQGMPGGLRILDGQLKGMQSSEAGGIVIIEVGSNNYTRLIYFRGQDATAVQISCTRSGTLRL